MAARAVARGELVPVELIRQIAWTEIDRIRTAAGIGGGMLQVRERGDWVDLIRYSNAWQAGFTRSPERSRRPARLLPPSAA